METHNIASLLAAQLAHPQRHLYRHYADGAWADVAAAELARAAARWQGALRALGFAAGDRVALCLRNGPTWVALDQALLGLRMVVVPLYAEDNADSIAWCFHHSGARLLIVESARIARALAACGVDPAAIVVLKAEQGGGFRAAQELLPAGAKEFCVAATAAGELATICYTSGTAGRPKGVMLSHDNILSNVEACLRTGLARADDVFLSLLPLSHMFERTGGYYLPLRIGAKVVFARSVAQLAEDFASQAPSVVFAVPRVFEKFAARIRKEVEASALKRWLLAACVWSGYRLQSGSGGLLDRMAAPPLRALVARRILDRLGGRLRLAVVGGAALDPAVARLFIGLGLPVLHGYGMTEAAPVVSVNRPEDNLPESVGRPLDGIETRLDQVGELLVRGRNVMLGYWRDAEATALAIDGQGWLHTGDIARIADGRIYVRGRLKDILVMSNGEKLPPQDVELAILGDAVFEQGILVGEGKPFLTFIAVAREDDEKALVRRANDTLRAFPRYVRVRRVIRTSEPWTVENGMLTPTMKVRRGKVIERFAPQIDEVYGEAAAIG